MGVEQSTVSNLVRLLKLPEAWRRRIISREISERHARAVLPFVKYAAIMEAFEEYLDEHCPFDLDQNDNRRGLPTVGEWEEETVPQIVRDATRTMDGMHGDRMYYHPRYGRVAIFEPDAFQEKKLGIIKIACDGKTEHVATNVEFVGRTAGQTHWKPKRKTRKKSEAAGTDNSRRQHGRLRFSERCRRSWRDEAILDGPPEATAVAVATGESGNAVPGIEKPRITRMGAGSGI